MDPTIQSFTIKGLLGEKTVSIDFKTGLTILMADNGIGKTTILGIIYAVLAGKLHRLRRVQFDSIVVEFTSGVKIEILAAMIQAPLDLSKSNPSIRRLLRQVPEQLVYQLFDETKGFDMMTFRRYPLANELSEVAGVPPHYLFNILHERQKDAPDLFEGLDSPVEIRKRLNEEFPLTVLYFPTYRRIEEDLEHLGFEKREGFRSEVLIQFGMTDVNERVKKVTDQIKNSSVAWYSKINGQMLSQLVDGIQVDATTRSSIQDKSALKIVLDRIGENITHGHKNHIIELVDSGEIEQERYNSLVYFLSNLVKIYDQQREMDNAIKAFTGVCNKYLVEKEFVYNESDVDICIQQKWNKKPIELAKLSSGEKQIISIFSRLYLEPGRPLALLFDEPELSLSIEWQRMLIPDIIESGRCKFLLATTHSPFVFENACDSHAFDLSQFITRDQS
jgi:predicted ATPase/AraC-like DNA-binding protein